MRPVVFVCVCLALCAGVWGSRVTSEASGTLMAGVAVTEFHTFTPIGVPLAGYNHGDRRVPDWPIPKKTPYTTFMTPAKGTYGDNAVKALCLDDGKGGKLAIVTLDVIGSDQTMNELVAEQLEIAGSAFGVENVIVSGSHTHSGPGAVSPRLLWSLAPATDLVVDELQEAYVKHIAATILAAEAAMEPAMMDIGIAQVKNLTVNRIAKNIPWISVSDVDPNMGVYAVNKADGSVLATVWNFAFHSVCFGPSNMKMSADLAGSGSRAIEAAIGGTALYINGAAGDVDPARGQVVGDDTLPNMCDGGSETSDDFAGGKLLADRVVAKRASLSPTADLSISTSFVQADFGPASLNLTLGRLDNCTTGGPLDLCSLCRILDCSANLHLDQNWLDEAPAYIAARFDVNGKSFASVTIPGELLTTPAQELRAKAMAMGFDGFLIDGYSMGHGGYFASERVYDYIGAPNLYENILTFWGQHTTGEVILPPAVAALQKLAVNHE